MRRFVFHISYVLMTFLSFLIIWHLFYINYWTFLEKIDSRTWIWGDSQMVQGLDPMQLELRKPHFSLARHGNGYFDLISFAHRIPENSDVILGLGPLYYRYQRDRSQSGYQLDAMKALLEVNKSKAFSVDFDVIIKNIRRQEFSFQYLNSFNHGKYSDEPDSTKRSKYIRDIIDVIDQNKFDDLFEFKDRWLHHSMSEIEGKNRSVFI